MARFSVGGDEEDGNEERPTHDRPLPKRPRVGTPIVYTFKRSNATTTASAASLASPSNSRERATTSAVVPGPEEPVSAEEESEEHSSDESETSWSDSSSSESESDEEEQEQQQPQPQPQQNQRSDEVQPTEARVDSRPNGNGTSRESEGPGGPVSVTLTDPDVLDCPICCEPLCSPVYQCENGHIACALCCTTMKNNCASCCFPIGYNRCRAIEKVLESVRITCRNMPYGCMETLSYSKKLAHEKACNYSPCSCPHASCDYVGMSKCLYAHFSLKHPYSSKKFLFNSVFSISLDNNQKHVFLQELGQSMLFILSRSIETVGSFVNVVCVAPTSEKKAFLYDLTATAGESSIKLKSFVDFVPKWKAQPPAKICLLVPSDFISTSGHLKLELIIRKNHVVGN